MADVTNLTPHAVRVVAEDGSLIHEYPPSGDVARLGTVDLGTQAYGLPSGGVELVEFGHLLSQPPRDNGWYIVSLPAALACPREDFLVPYREVRDDQGRIIGCRQLARPV